MLKSDTLYKLSSYSRNAQWAEKFIVFDCKSSSKVSLFVVLQSSAKSSNSTTKAPTSRKRGWCTWKMYWCPTFRRSMTDRFRSVFRLRHRVRLSSTTCQQTASARQKSGETCLSSARKEVLRLLQPTQLKDRLGKKKKGPSLRGYL